MKFLKEMKWEALMTGFFYILLGIVALVIPETMEKTLAYLIGVVLILAGAVSMICYLLRDPHENYYHNDFVYGLISIALGCIALYKVEIVIGLVPFLLGLLVLVSGCTKLQDVIDMKRLNYGNWVVMLAVAVVNVGLGVLLITNPFKAANLLFRLLGVSLILSGLTDCVTTVYFAGKISRFLKGKEKVYEPKEKKEGEAKSAIVQTQSEDSDLQTDLKMIGGAAEDEDMQKPLDAE